MGTAPDPANMKEFFNQVNEIRKGIEQIQKRSDEMERLHKQTLAAVTIEEKHEMSKKIEQHMEHTTSISNNVRRLLKETSNTNKKLETTLEGESSDPNLRIRQAQHAQLTKQFIDIMNYYSSVQEKYRDKYHENLQRQYLIVKPSATKEELEKIVDTDGDTMMTQQIFSMKDQQHIEARKVLEEMRERHQDIMLIEKSIMELHQLFLEMATLVDQQGDLVNQIEAHVDRAAHYTEQAAGEMRIAVEHQKSRLKVIL